MLAEHAAEEPCANERSFASIFLRVRVRACVCVCVRIYGSVVSLIT